MPAHLLPALIAGAVAGGLFLLIAGAGLGFLFMFFPSLPVFYIGLSKGSRAGYIALLAAFFVIAGVGITSAIFFLLLIGLPAWYMARQSLLHKDTEWFPIGLIMVHLAVYGCVLLSLITYYYTSIPGGLPQLLSNNIHTTFADMGEEYARLAEILANAWSFIIFPITLWLWGMMLYAHGWLAQKILVRRREQIRPDYAVTPFIVPSWMLSLLAICALASLIASPQLRFLGKSALITLLLPYFFSGIALLHQQARAWPNGRIFLFFIYFCAFTQFWPALMIAGLGLIWQIKHLSAGQTSSKS